MVKRIVSLVFISFSLISTASLASHMVSGYYRSSGTYVASHMSMDPGEARSTGYSYHNNELVPNSYDYYGQSF